MKLIAWLFLFALSFRVDTLSDFPHPPVPRVHDAYPTDPRPSVLTGDQDFPAPPFP